MMKLNPAHVFDEKIRRKNIIIRIVITLLLTIFLWKVFVFIVSDKNEILLPGDAKLNGSMNFEEADRKMQEARFVPFSEIFENTDGPYRWYKGVDIYDHTPYFSAMGVAENNKQQWAQIIHFFQEPESTDMKNPGKIITDIKEKLTESIGMAPTWNDESGAKCWEWELTIGLKVVLFYSVPNDLAALTYGYF